MSTGNRESSTGSPKPSPDPPETLRLVGFIALAIGLLFQLQHWPWANVLLAGSWLMILATSVWRFLRSNALTPSTIARDLFTLALFSLLIMHVLHLPGTAVPLVVLVVTGAMRAWYGSECLGKARGLRSWYFRVSLLLVLLGVVFRIQHWPFGTALLLLGLAFGAIWFFLPNDAAQ